MNASRYDVHATPGKQPARSILILALLVAAGCSAGDEPVTTPDPATKVEPAGNAATLAADDKKDFDGMRGAVTGGEAHPGAALYWQHCSQCHSKPVPRAPDKTFLEMLPGDTILHTLNEGVSGLLSQLQAQRVHPVAWSDCWDC